jgi:hypothetical protein
MDPRRRMAQRARCLQEDRNPWFLYRFPLEPIDGRYPVLEIWWHEKGLMHTKFLDHDPALAPQETTA